MNYITLEGIYECPRCDIRRGTKVSIALHFSTFHPGQRVIVVERQS